jgi:hypothetical protein
MNDIENVIERVEISPLMIVEGEIYDVTIEYINIYLYRLQFVGKICNKNTKEEHEFSEYIKLK